MKTILITGGTDGIGKGLTLYYLNNGFKVFAVGSNAEKGKKLLAETNNSTLTFIQADLSLISENLKLVKNISEQTDALDGLVLCAASLKPQSEYKETAEGTEFTFSLYYLSRYLLCHQLKGLLDRSSEPFILNVAAPGMKGPVFWDDLQMKQKYNGQQAQFHGSRLNDLLGVWFSSHDPVRKIRYILFNPMAARTPGAAKMAGNSSFMKLTMTLYYKFAGKDVDEIIKIIQHDVAATKEAGLSAYKLDKPVDLNMGTFDADNAEKLNVYTEKLVEKFL